MEAVIAAGAARPTSSRRLAARLRRESIWLSAMALYASVLLVGLPKLLAPDSWLAFVGGRELLNHGLPSKDELTTWAAGADWVDQQWLGQLLIYGAEAAGGLRLALFVNALVLVTTLGLAALCARRRGASPGNVAIVLVAVMLVAAPNTALRTETLVYPLFVSLVYMLGGDARAHSRQVLLVLPLLVVWANIHGSVLLAGAIVAVHGLFRLIRGHDRPVAGLLMVAPLTMFASPYGFSIADHYLSTVGNSAFPDLLQEWQAPSFPIDLRFFALALGGTWLVARARELPASERVTFLLLVVAGLVARRYKVWLALYSAVALPALVDREWRRAPLVRERSGVVLALAGGLAVVAAFVFAVVRPSDELRRAYPKRVETAVQRELEREPTLRVFASEMYADWLLYSVPEVRGRIAFDTRFELLNDRQLRDLIAFNNRIEGWRSVARGHRLLVLETMRHRKIEQLARERGARTVFEDSRVTVVLRPTTTS